IPPVEFASPLRHGGKSYSVMGFPGGDRQGRNATGKLHAADAKGLVQMDRGGALSILGGFSGAPVWSPEVSAFVGIVVTEQARSDVSWCIPSRRLCEFHPELRVRFRIPPMDRPVIHDYEVDDPNLDLFGKISDNGTSRLRARIRRQKGAFVVKMTYEHTCNGAHSDRGPRGHFVTFVAYPDFEKEDQDSYELFGEIHKHKNGSGWFAEQEIYPDDLFAVAAIADAGDIALTLDLEEMYKKRKR
ncbi:MAG TPA: hypothetical protein VFU03_02900, partial [Gemmatimonadales bacterium]|nr:hypothetical protein [Gemmatimonadales bacterium]